jgi:hypothetical protein
MLSATLAPTFPLHYSSLEPYECLQYRPLQERHVLRQDALIAEDLA